MAAKASWYLPTLQHTHRSAWGSTSCPSLAASVRSSCGFATSTCPCPRSRADGRERSRGETTCDLSFWAPPLGQRTPSGPESPALTWGCVGAMTRRRLHRRRRCERLPDDRFRNGLRLHAVTAENDDAGVVVLHRQPAVVLRHLHLADVLAALQPARRQASPPGEGFPPGSRPGRARQQTLRSGTLLRTVRVLIVYATCNGGDATRPLRHVTPFGRLAC